MTTALDLVTYAYKDAGLLGVGQTLLGNLAQEGLVRLNRMMAQWNRKRWLVFHLVTVSKTSTGATSYTIGTGGDFNTDRPARLEGGCFLRQLVSVGQPVDNPLKLITSREQYNSLTIKGLTGPSAWIFYDAAMPLGVVYPYPVPQAGTYQLHLSIMASLQSFAALGTVVTLPPEYELAIQQNLALFLRKGNRLPEDGELTKMATASLNTIKNENAQIPVLTVPAVLLRPSIYNVWSDTTY